MSRGEETTDSQNEGPSPFPKLRAILYLLLVIVLTFAIELVGQFVSADRLFEAAVSTLSPEYSPGRRLQVALQLMQVAVLYFGGLAAVFNFIDIPDSLGTEMNERVSNVFVLAVLSVSISALSSVVAILKISTGLALLCALLSMGFAFFLSFFVPVVVLLRRVGDTTRQDYRRVSKRERSDTVDSSTDTEQSGTDDDSTDTDRHDTDEENSGSEQSVVDECSDRSERLATTQSDTGTDRVSVHDERTRQWRHDRQKRSEPRE